MLPNQRPRVALQVNRSTRHISCAAAAIACWLWGSLAIMAGVALLGLSVFNRTQPETQSSTLCFRLVILACGLLQTFDFIPIRLQRLNFDPRVLYVYNNRDYDDVFLIGSALLSFLAAAVIWATGLGLARGSRLAIRIVVGVSALLALVFSLCTAWCIIHGVDQELLIVVTLAAVVPAIVAITTSLEAVRVSPASPEGTRPPNPLLGTLFLIILAMHAALMVPVLTFLWLFLGVVVRQAWLRLQG